MTDGEIDHKNHVVVKTEYFFSQIFQNRKYNTVVELRSHSGHIEVNINHQVIILYVICLSSFPVGDDDSDDGDKLSDVGDEVNFK